MNLRFISKNRDFFNSEIEIIQDDVLNSEIKKKFDVVYCKITSQHLVTNLLMLAAVRHLSTCLSLLFSSDSYYVLFLSSTAHTRMCCLPVMSTFLHASLSFEIFLMKEGISCKSQSKMYHLQQICFLTDRCTASQSLNDQLTIIC